MDVLIIDDHLLFSESLGLALEVKGMSVVRVANGAAALEAISERSFDLILLDINLPDIHGEVLLKSLKNIESDNKIIVVSALKVKKKRLIDLGANGFIHKGSNMAMMFRGIDAVVNGNNFFGDADLDHQSKQGLMLSPRQLEILEVIIEGSTNKVIAHRLAISEGTVKQHISSIFKELEVNNRAECIRKASQLGFTS